MPLTRRPRHAVVLSVVLAVALAGAPLIVAADEVVVGEPRLSVLAPDNHVAAGEETTIDLFLSNEGSVRRAGPAQFTDRVTTARATRIRVDDGSLPINVSTAEIPAGSVPVGTTGPFAVEITVPESIPPGTYDVPVEISHTHTFFVEYNPQNPGVDPRFVDRSVTTETTIPIVVEDTAQFAVTGATTDASIDDDGAVAIDIRNTGTRPARNVRVQVESASGDLTFGTTSPRSNTYAGTLAPDEEAEVRYPVVVSDGAVLRNHTVNVAVTYTDTDGIRRQRSDLSAAVRPLPEQSFATAGVGGDLRVGAEGTVRGELVNEGPGVVRSPVVVLETNSQNIDADEGEYALPDLEAGERAPFEFGLSVSDSADPGSRELSVTVRYRNADGDAREADPAGLRVGIDAGRDVFGVEPADAAVTAGERTTVRLRVTNQGDEPLTEIRAKAFLTEPLSSDDDEAFVASLAPGESAPVVFDVAADGSALEKTYPLAVDFAYHEPDGDSKLTDTYRVPVAVDTTERQGQGNRLPLLGVGAGIVVLVVAGVLYRRRSR